MHTTQNLPQAVQIHHLQSLTLPPVTATPITPALLTSPSTPAPGWSCQSLREPSTTPCTSSTIIPPPSTSTSFAYPRRSSGNSFGRALHGRNVNTYSATVCHRTTHGTTLSRFGGDPTRCDSGPCHFLHSIHDLNSGVGASL